MKHQTSVRRTAAAWPAALATVATVATMAVLASAAQASGVDILADAPAHQHDAAQLDIARDGGRVVLRFRAAAQAVVGFEHAPRTEDERAAMAVAAATLGRASPSFRWPTAAQCKVIATTLEVPGAAKVHDTAHEGTGHEHEEHADYAASWTVDCAVPAALTSVYVDLARHLQPRVRLQVSVATDTGQAQLVWAAPAAERVPLQ